MATTINAVLSR